MYSYFKKLLLPKCKVLHHHRKHLENELAEIVTIGDHEFEEVIKEYEEEILGQEEVLEPLLAD